MSSSCRPRTARPSNASTPPAWPQAVRTTARQGCARTIPATSLASYSTLTATMSKPCTTAPGSVPPRPSRSHSDGLVLAASSELVDRGLDVGHHGEVLRAPGTLLDLQQLA